MSQVTNLAFFRSRRGQSEARGAALAALVEPTRLRGCAIDKGAENIWRGETGLCRIRRYSGSKMAPHVCGSLG
jgi:hypothetical protein